MRAFVLPLVLCGLFGGCVEVPQVPANSDPARDGGESSTDGGPVVEFDAGPPPVDAAPPTVRITSPANAASFAADVSTITVEGAAADDVGVSVVRVALGPNAPINASTSDFWRTWRVTLPLPAGTHKIRAIVSDSAAKSAEDTITVTRAPSRADAAPPSLAITSPAATSRTTRAAVLVIGTAADDTGLTAVEARVDGVSQYTLVETSDAFANWRASLGLAPDVTNTVRVRATDLAGNRVERTVTVTSLTAADRQPPSLVVSEPTEGASLAATTVRVRGTASDNVGIAKVEVAIGDGDYTLAQTNDGFGTWERTVALVMGQNQIRVRATDASELETVVTRTVTSTVAPDWSAPKSYELRLAAPRDRSVSLVLDKQGMGEVIPESVRRSIIILNLDPSVLMTNTMETIKNACGAGWQSLGFNPRCPSSWGTQELNLWRLLTMTPANVNVAGTSIEGTAEIADILSSLGLIDDFNTILADTLGIDKRVEIVDTANAVAALRDDLIKTHPNANANGTLPVTIQDGFSDMRELATRFGPSGSHPGFLDPSAPTFSQVLTPSFRMAVRGTSNLTWHDGIDLSQGKDYIAILPTPSSDVITFDFTNTLSVTGLAANPTVDLTFIMREAPTFLRSAVRENDEEPPAHPGQGQMWSASKWLIEYVFVDASFRKYRGRAPYAKAYTTLFGLVTQAVITVGANDDNKLPNLSNPLPGWARFYTLFGLGSPPKAQYLWEMIAEIAQIRLRDGGVAEGQGHVRFELQNLPVGLTAQQIIAQMRPALEAQKSALAQRLLGDYRTNNGAVDLYLHGTAGNLYLFFAHSSDPLPRATTYATPGFYSDAALTQKVSSTEAMTSGDAVHEKLKLSGAPARTVYVKDDSGGVYRLEIDAASSDRVTLRASKKL